MERGARWDVKSGGSGLFNLQGCRYEFSRVLSYLSSEKGTDMRIIDASRQKEEVGRRLAEELKQAIGNVFMVSMLS